MTATKKHGGRRLGAGKKAVLPVGTVVNINVKLTSDQRKTYVLLGGPAWLRNKLDEERGKL